MRLMLFVALTTLLCLPGCAMTPEQEARTVQTVTDAATIGASGLGQIEQIARERLSEDPDDKWAQRVLRVTDTTRPAVDRLADELGQSDGTVDGVIDAGMKTASRLVPWPWSLLIAAAAMIRAALVKHRVKNVVRAIDRAKTNGGAVAFDDGDTKRVLDGMGDGAKEMVRKIREGRSLPL